MTNGGAWLRGDGDACDLSPGGECLMASAAKLDGGVLLGAASKNVGDLIMDGKETLDLQR